MLGDIVNAVSSFFGADKAKDAQVNAANEANRVQKDIYDQQRADQEPWRKSGLSALGQMEDGDFKRDFTSADFQKDPGYDFRMAEGQKALERSAAARGGLQSGGTLKALSRYGQDYASNEYQNAYNRFNADRDRRFGRLSSLAGMGQGATNQMGAYGQNYAAAYGDNVIGAGNARAGAAMAQANAIGSLGTSFDKSMQDMTSAAFMGGGGMPRPQGQVGSVNAAPAGASNTGALSGYNYGQSPSSFFGVSDGQSLGGLSRNRVERN